VGKRIGEWVYEIFITTLPTEGFLVEDVLDLYHGRGAFEAVRGPMKMSKKTSIAGVPIRSVDKNSGRSRVNGPGTSVSLLDRPCKKRTYVKSNGHLPKRHLLCSS
jgi:hypothetical protein